VITIALDTATDRCTVAAADGAQVVERHLDGARRHATSILGLLDEVLAAIGAAPRDVRRILLADGPGSFTGLRVSATVAKAMAWRREVEWRVTPSLLVRAAAHAPPGGGAVVALSDALRGEVYAGCWEFAEHGVSARHGMPRATRPADLSQFGPVDVLVGSVPDALVAGVEDALGCRLSAMALPDARTLITLATLPGGTAGVDDVEGWEPDYGRPAEAQAVWERKHGRPLPTPPGIAR
jgi:tRNA threonylcarbamoyladenosine biosynthesis protein TsaB